MRLIIDISKNEYNDIIEQVKKGDYPDMGLGKIIANGTPIKTVTNAKEAEDYPINQEENWKIVVPEFLRDIANIKDLPHGKWIKIFENPFTNGYVCPFCGHKIQVTEQFLPKVTECEGCGAKMDGGEEE